MKQRNALVDVAQVFVLAASVLVFRIVYVNLYHFLEVKLNASLSDYISLYFADYATLLVSLALDVTCVWCILRRVPYGQMPGWRVCVYCVCIVFVSLIGTAIGNRSMLMGGPGTPTDGWLLLFSFLAILLINTLVVVAFDLALYFKKSTRLLADEGGKKRKAQFQYQQLKQQLNPHFLFNSLNILDYLVQNGDNQRASDFIKKLAGVYRYLLNTGEQTLVPLREELRFVQLYADLLKERFPEGLFVDVEADEASQAKLVIPCGLQMLVENATKHNIVNVAQPLSVHIYTEKNAVVVSNNLQPRIMQNSTGIGLQNIEKQYYDVAGKNIEIHKTDTEFLVKLPLL